MPILLLIRHGENEYSKTGRLAGRLPGVSLNERGRQQAAELARALTNAPLAAVYSSPLERAMETAQPIAESHKLKIVQVPGLLESNIGEWQGRSIGRLAMTKYWRVIQGAPSRARHPGGESFAETQARVAAALEQIISSHRDRDMVACVFHADPIRLATAHFIGLPLDNFQRLACSTASVTMLGIAQVSAHLIWLNRTPPFEFPARKKQA